MVHEERRSKGEERIQSGSKGLGKRSGRRKRHQKKLKERKKCEGAEEDVDVGWRRRGK